jgi:signal peptidase I
MILPLVALKLLLKAYRTPSGSMAPTILISDRIFTRRSFSPPARGEVIVFATPEPGHENSFIKRVVGLPGDTIETIGGRPVINGWLVPQCHVGPYPFDGPTFELYVEYLGDRVYGTLFDHVLDDRSCKVDADCGGGTSCRAGVCGALEGPFAVRAGEVFVLGDNRDNSHDSRRFFGGRGGGVPLGNVGGRGLLVWMSVTPGRFGANVQGPPVLPAAASSLQGALDKCLRERPSLEQTTPPRR